MSLIIELPQKSTTADSQFQLNLSVLDFAWQSRAPFLFKVDPIVLLCRENDLTCCHNLRTEKIHVYRRNADICHINRSNYKMHAPKTDRLGSAFGYKVTFNWPKNLSAPKGKAVIADSSSGLPSEAVNFGG